MEQQRWKGWESRGREGWRESYRQGKCPRFPWCLLESETKSRSTAVRCVTDKTVNRERIRGYLPGNLTKEDIQVVLWDKY